MDAADAQEPRGRAAHNLQASCTPRNAAKASAMAHISQRRSSGGPLSPSSASEGASNVARKPPSEGGAAAGCARSTSGGAPPSAAVPSARGTSGTDGGTALLVD